MDQQLLSLEEDTSNYNKVKNLVVAQMVKEGYMSDEEGGYSVTSGGAVGNGSPDAGM